jgi:hypothetical protein
LSAAIARTTVAAWSTRSAAAESLGPRFAPLEYPGRHLTLDVPPERLFHVAEPEPVARQGQRGGERDRNGKAADEQSGPKRHRSVRLLAVSR